jgi:hypothetical protein
LFTTDHNENIFWLKTVFVDTLLEIPLHFLRFFTLFFIRHTAMYCCSYVELKVFLEEDNFKLASSKKIELFFCDPLTSKTMKKGKQKLLSR